MSAFSKRRGRRTRGIALADFITGSIILAGSVSAWAALTRAQIDSAAYADRRAVARSAALQALDDARFEGPSVLASVSSKEPAKDGFRLVRTFAVPNLMAAVSGEPAGRLEARPLVADGSAANAKGLYEVRATVIWRGEHGGPDRVEISTALVGGGS